MKQRKRLVFKKDARQKAAFSAQMQQVVAGMQELNTYIAAAAQQIQRAATAVLSKMRELEPIAIDLSKELAWQRLKYHSWQRNDLSDLLDEHSIGHELR